MTGLLLALLATWRYLAVGFTDDGFAFFVAIMRDREQFHAWRYNDVHIHVGFSFGVIM